MKYGSVCSGIEAATAAWHPLGWEPAFFSEIEQYPRAVLQHHYPDVPLHGDFTTIGDNDYGPIRLLVGGTPCQSFSVAGLRRGLDDDRGNLALEYLRLAERTRAEWLVWENVPGVLSSNGGRDFGAFLGGLVELGYGYAYRTLDAQYFGVPQRRRRVFVVACLGDWARAAAVLFERESLSGNPAPCRRTKFGITGDVAASSGGGSHWDGSGVHPSLNQPHNTGGIGASNQEVFSQRGSGLVPVAKDNKAREADRGQNAIVSGVTIHGADKTARAASFADVAGALRTKPPGSVENCSTTAALHCMRVRRLTPTECERLQGFPDGYTAIPWRNKPANQAPDGHRYKALGNSMAVPVMRWIGERIQMVENLQEQEDE